MTERSFAVLARQAGSAALASSMARLVSAAPMFGTAPTTAPVAGLSTLMVPPPSAATHSPATKQASRNKVESLSVSFVIIVNAARLELI